MKAGIGNHLILISIGLAVAGCTGGDPGPSGGTKVGRYRIVSSAEGVAVYESVSWFSRFFESLFGQTPSAKVRIGTFMGEQGDLSRDEVTGTVVRMRKLQGPAAKPTAMKRPWEVRLLDRKGGDLAPFFYFRKEPEAHRFASEVEVLLSLGNSSDAQARSPQGH